MKLKKHTIFYTASVLSFSNIIMQGIGFVYRIFLTKFAGTSALGVYKLVMQLYSIMLTVCVSGASLVAINQSASLYHTGLVAKLKKTMNYCFFIFFGIFCVFSVFIIAFPDFFAVKILGDIRTKDALYIMILCILLTGIENIIKSSLIGIQKVKITAFSEIVEQVLRVIIVLTLVYIFGSNNLSKISFLIILGMTISEVFSIVFLGVWYKKTYKTKNKCFEPIFSGIFKTITSVSFAAAINNIIASASVIILPSRLVLAGFTNDMALSELGKISGIAMPILILPIAIIGSYSQVVMPNISKSKSSLDRKNIKRKINKLFEATGLIGIPATTLLVYLSKPLSRILFDTDFAYLYMALLGVSVVFMYFQIATSSILNGLAKEKIAVFNSVIGETLQLFITFFLCSIPKLNIYGYILGLIISPLIVSLLNTTYILKDYSPSFIKFLFRPILISVFLLFFVNTFYTFIIRLVGSQMISSILTLVLSFILYFLTLFVTGTNYIAYFKNLIISDKFTFTYK